MRTALTYDSEQLSDFCTRWKVRELALFGSVLREDFTSQSDVDVLVTFEPVARWSLWDWSDMTDELQAIFGHKVDLVEKKNLRNPFRRHHIMHNHEVVYAA